MTKTEYISEATSPLSDRTIDITTFYQRLASLGLQRSYVKDILLPDCGVMTLKNKKVR